MDNLNKCNDHGADDKLNECQIITVIPTALDVNAKLLDKELEKLEGAVKLFHSNVDKIVVQSLRQLTKTCQSLIGPQLLIQQGHKYHQLALGLVATHSPPFCPDPVVSMVPTPQFTPSPVNVDLFRRLLITCPPIVKLDTGNPDSRNYELVPKGAKSTFHQIVERFDDSETQPEAEKKARFFSGGLDPVLHNPHKDGEQFHYHLYDLCYVRKKGYPLIFYNYHFTFGPKVLKVSGQRKNLKEALKKQRMARNK